jgi:hypothetical protein
LWFVYELLLGQVTGSLTTTDTKPELANMSSADPEILFQKLPEIPGASSRRQRLNLDEYANFFDSAAAVEQTGDLANDLIKLLGPEELGETPEAKLEGSEEKTEEKPEGSEEKPEEKAEAKPEGSEEKLEEKPEEKSEEKPEGSAEKLEEKPEEKTEVNSEAKTEENTEEVEGKTEEKTEAKLEGSEEKLEEKPEEKSEVRLEEKAEEKPEGSEEKPEEKPEEKSEEKEEKPEEKEETKEEEEMRPPKVTSQDYLSLILNEPPRVIPNKETVALAKLLFHWFSLSGSSSVMSAAIVALLKAYDYEKEEKEGKEEAKEEAKEEEGVAEKPGKEDTGKDKDKEGQPKEDKEEQPKEDKEVAGTDECRKDKEEEKPAEQKPLVLPSPLLFPPLPATKPVMFSYHGNLETLLDEPHEEKQWPLAKFHLLLGKAITLIRTRPSPSSNQFLFAEPPQSLIKFTKADNLYVQQRTSLSNTRCSERVLKAYTTSQPDLRLTEEEVEVFAHQPLRSLLSDNVEMSKKRMDDMVEVLPLDVASLEASKTKVAQNTLARMQEDITLAFNEAKSKLVPHLTCLTGKELDLLKAEVLKLKKRPGRRPRTLGGEAAAEGKEEGGTREGSKIMQSMMFRLRQLQETLKQMQRAMVAKIQSEIRQLNQLANDISRSGTKEEQLVFHLQRLTGAREIFSFEAAASILISSEAESDFKKFNPFAPREQSEEVLNAISQIMLETILVSQLNNCMASVLHLVNHLFDLLQIEVGVLMDGTPEGSSSGSGVSGISGISKEMLQFAMDQTNYTASDAYAKLRGMKAFLQRSSQEEVLGGLGPEDRMKVAFTLFHHSGFDEGTCLELIRAELNPAAFLDLAKRKCYWDGKKLILPNTRSLEAGKERHEPDLGVMVHVLEHTAQSLATNLAASRCYIRYSEEQKAYLYDPRFLIFEFVTTFLLHRRQVELVLDFKQACEAGKSSVHQMIMGAGKTSVVCPMLVLMLADGKSLVTQVVLNSLLEMSRDVLRSVFSSVVHKRVYTLSFDRSNSAGESPGAMRTLYTRINRARLEGAVVCTTPEAVKSLMLKYVDLLQCVQASEPLIRIPLDNYEGIYPTVRREMDALRDQMEAYEKTADIMRDLIRLWGPKHGGVVLLDEVDVILHPLKSELNFPIGEKKPLALTPLRYLFAIHLLNAVLYHMFGASTLLATEEKLLQKISKVLQTGEEECWVQRNPHTVLLSPEFYEKELKTLFAEWSLIWLHKQKGIKEGIAKAQEAVKEVAKLEKTISEPPAEVVASMDEEHLLISYITHLLPDATACSFVNRNFDPESIQLLNLARLWVCSFLPHCISKIDRIMYGLLQADDLKAFEAQTGMQPQNFLC